MVAAKNTPDWDVLGAELSKPFPENEIKSYSAKGSRMRYIDARQAMERLDNAVGCGNWSDEYRVVDPEAKAVECVLTVCGISKSDVGYPNSGADAQDDNKEPLKAAYSDAFKRAAVKWGIGRHQVYGIVRARPEVDQVMSILKDPQHPERTRVRQHIIDNFGELKELSQLSSVPSHVLTGALQSA